MLRVLRLYAKRLWKVERAAFEHSGTLPQVSCEGILSRQPFSMKGGLLCARNMGIVGTKHQLEKRDARMAEQLIEAVLAEAGEKAIQVMFRETDGVQ